MPSKRIEAALRRLMQDPRPEPDPAPDAALEAELLTRFDQQGERPRAGLEAGREAGGRAGGWTHMLAFARVHRWALASVLAGVLGFGACYAPADVEVPLGVTVEFTSDDENPGDLVEQIVRYVEDSTGASEVSVSAVKSDTGPLQIRMQVWGPGVPADLEEELGEVFPQLEVAQLATHPLEGHVRTTLGRRLGHEWLDLALAEDDVERARVELLTQLAAQGVEGDVDIEIEQSNGHREVRVRVEQHVQAHDE